VVVRRRHRAVARGARLVWEEIARRREEPTNVFYFGKQMITTRVHMMMPAGTDSVPLDVLDYIWEESYDPASQSQ